LRRARARLDWLALHAGIAAILAGCATTPPAVAPTPKEGPRYAIGGDSRDDSAHVVPWAFREAKARGASAFLFLGDMELTPALDEHFRSNLALLAPVPFFPVLGNHEVRLLGLAPTGHDAHEDEFRRRFLDTAQTPVHSAIPNMLAYGVTLEGGVHFVALDNVSQKGFGIEQLAWLDRDLAAARTDPTVRFIIVGMHKPLARNGRTTHSMDADGPAAVKDSDLALALMVKYRVSMIVASHLHTLMTFQTAGIPTYITGGLGAPLDRTASDVAYHHFLQVDVVSDQLQVTVVRFGGDGARGTDDD
jgi:hypothetical protein